MTSLAAPMDVNWQYIYRKPRGSSKGPCSRRNKEGKSQEKKKTTLKKQQQQTEEPVLFASAPTITLSSNGSPEQPLAPVRTKGCWVA